ncbi:hypothetical protein L6164_015524 [Bauhinia variegata]|uniref:Uncharacterized protein n=1 Tax=Bauhinia variegata TaxID=167791 RepID=A0ACB9NPK9_BAUVA|nr:hypothetical protein L6164_015524 [Bauhinia variegata]
MEMARLSSKRSSSTNLCEILLLHTLVVQILFQVAFCRSIVRNLPGFEGPLPFVLETGYVGVGESEEAQLFYYFIESENNPKEDPLLLWLTGGPGCSALSGVVFEIGPLAFKSEDYKGGLPNLVVRQHSWTKASSVIFVDLPAGTGFSYVTTERAANQSDWKLVHHGHQFLRKWLIDHPEFLSNKVYVGGDSYSGIPVPVLVQEILNANEKGIQPWIYLEGYLAGNAVTSATEGNYAIPYSHGMGLISDELYESLQRNCRAEYLIIDPRNVLCRNDMQAYQKSVSGINTAQILEPSCEFASPKPLEISRRYLTGNPWTQLRLNLPPPSCRTFGYVLCAYWANDDDVRKALRIRKGTKGQWVRCNTGIPFTYNIPTSFQYHVNLSKKGYRSLIYSGDHDLIVPFLGTQAWIRSLNYSIVDDWRQWSVDGQVAGYTRTYSNRMTFATVKGAGHTAPEYKPKECLAMYSRWLSYKPL